MPHDLYTELKKAYVVRTKIKTSSKKQKDGDDLEQDKINQIEARYMDWYRLLQSRE